MQQADSAPNVSVQRCPIGPAPPCLLHQQLQRLGGLPCNYKAKGTGGASQRMRQALQLGTHPAISAARGHRAPMRRDLSDFPGQAAAVLTALRNEKFVKKLL